ncbi:MAG: exodeoxyribonuclease V subunit gamma, partial [Desulfobacula sp.]|nr:exodeoxyribonuclease V subunit gamma [Desulfobacula sp.]
MLNIVKSNKMENLMQALLAVLKCVPDNPMVPEWIGIQSRGMKQWIAAQMADNLGICANIKFLFPRQMIDQVIYDQFNDQKESLNEDILPWYIMKLLHKSKSVSELSHLQDYIMDDETGKKQYQLSMKIAKIFDDYQVYRPSMLMEWQRKNSHAFLKDSDAQWQAWLWQSIISDYPHNHIAYKISRFIEKFDEKYNNKDCFPLRISFFGISAIPTVFLQVFEKISQIIDINLFLLTPSNQFFFDIKSDKQLGKISFDKEMPINPDQLYYEVKNPLLSSLGTAGKNFQSSLESFDYHEPLNDLFLDPLSESDTMLAYLQSDILNLVYRKHDREDLPVKVESSDNSVSIHACHSPMREAQVLKDLLLNEFENDSDLAPHDIIVVMPDIESYAPFIESVFTLENSLPFSISDRKKRSESEPIEAFFKILSLKNSRFEQTSVLDLLISESIAQKFNISFDEIAMIENMVKDAAVLWGKDADHRKTFDLPPFAENTWFFGLQRLFMGMAMPENYDKLIKDILPGQSFEGLDLEVLGKLALFCDTLFTSLEKLAGKKNIEEWCQVLKSICNSLMDRNFQNGEDLTLLLQTIDKVKQDSHVAGFDQTISFDIIHSIIENTLDQNISQGKFLTGNIIFCNTMPMRSIPFKIVVFMGMDEKSFPGQGFRPEFDLIKKYPQPCDKVQRDEARNLFLETLLSARSKFVITYTGISIQDNSKTPCAGVVNELLDTIEQSFIFPESYLYHFFHPLHPFNREYFTKSHDYFSFSQDNCKIAKALSKKRAAHHMFLETDAMAKLQEPVLNITIFDMICFFKNPVQWYMKEGL